MDNWIYVILITMVPWIELRGSIPVGIGLGLDPLSVFVVAVLVNIAVIVPAFIFLDWFFHFMESNKFMGRIIDKTRGKAKPYVDKYGMIGLALFVGVPLPGTGAYSGSLAAHLLGIKNRKAFISIAAGVLIAGLTITVMSTGVKDVLGMLGI